jgi:hypothetical protein
MTRSLGSPGYRRRPPVTTPAQRTLSDVLRKQRQRARVEANTAARAAQAVETSAEDQAPRVAAARPARAPRTAVVAGETLLPPTEGSGPA